MLFFYRSLDPNDLSEYKALIDLYRCIQILFKHVNSTHLTKILLPGHLVPIFFAFIIAFNAIVHNTAPIVLLVAFCLFCCAVIMHYLFTLSLIWKITAISDELISSVKDSLKFHKGKRKRLLALTPIVIRLGTFGAFDKNIYNLNGQITIDFTINTLLF